MDKRVEARLRAGSSGSRPPAKLPPLGSWLPRALAIGAGILGIASLVNAIVIKSDVAITAVLVVLPILSAASLGAKLVRRRYRERRRG